MMRKYVKAVTTLAILALLGGCGSKGVVTNEAATEFAPDNERYSFISHVERKGVGDVLFIMAFSGGGTRASALSYGVLEELKDTWFETDTGCKRLLDEVDRISGVSGGSFTAAYYGLYGDQTFSTFKTDFLYKDIEGELSDRIFNVFNIFGRQFSGLSRTEDAIEVYDEHVFKGATYADLLKADGPFILINATDLNSHGQFVFSQDFFDLLCSDLSDLKLARSVAASSAVPVLFEPVLIKNYSGCSYKEPDWFAAAKKRAEEEKNLRLQDLVDTLAYYLDPENPPYATLVDGGVTDNLGLRSILSNAMLFEESEELQGLVKQVKPFHHVVVIVANASTTAVTDIGKSEEMPSIADVLTSMTDIQLHRYNLESNALLKKEVKEWAASISRPDMEVEPYFIELDFEDSGDKELELYFNMIPTSLSLEKDQVDKIIVTSRKLLREEPEYKRLLKNLGVVEE